MQIELLKLYSTNIDKENLIIIKNYFANYFDQKTIKEANKIWDANSFSNEEMDRWLRDKDILEK